MTTAPAAESLAVRRRVLAVDDEPRILDSISDLLEDDFEVIPETDAERALGLLQERPVGVILTDERMPRLNGHEFLRRARDRSQAVRLLITGYSDLPALVRAVNEGRIFGYVAKPWDPDALRAMVFQAAEVFGLLQDLDRERQMLQALMENTPDGIYFKDAQACYSRINPAHARLLGLADPAQAIGRVSGDFVDPRRAERYAANDRRVLAGQPLVGDVEAMPTADGPRWYSTTKVPILGAGGRVEGLVGLSRDITVHKRAEERAVLGLALQELRNAVLEMSQAEGWSAVLAVLHRLLRRFLDFDACSVTLVEAGGWQSHAFFDGRYRCASGPVLAAPLEAALRSGEPAYRRTREQMRVAGDDPALLAGSTQSVVDVPFPGGTIAVSSRRPQAFDEGQVELLRQFAEVVPEARRRLQDLHALSRKEEELRQAQKMEAIGQLAGGVAHDFNNLVTVITGYSQFMLRDLAAGDPHRAGAEQIHHAGLQAHRLIRQLLAFSRRQVAQPVVLDPNQVVSDLLQMLGRLLGERYSLVADLAPTAPRVHADPGQLEQVVMNLVINARDAMPGGGPVVVETAAEEVDDDLARIHDRPPGRYLRLAVRDTGVGMDAATLARVFEPFFTTKEPGRGTGLGLSTVHGIVAQSDGFLRVDTAPGAGSAFHVYLPGRSDEARAAAPPPTTAPAADGAGRTVLLVEDDAIVRQVTARMLRDRGYRVLEAADAEACLARYATAPEPIDLLLTDVALPGLSGGQLAERLRSSRPGLAVLYVSGFAGDEVVRRQIAAGDQPFLQKPFTSDALAAKVRAAITRTGAPP